MIRWLWRTLSCRLGTHVEADFTSDVVETRGDIDIIRCSHCGRKYTERVW